MADVPRWAPRITFPLALVGLGLSIYLTWEHYATGATLSCPNSGVVSCLKVTTSSQAMVFGVFPVALLGAIFFAAMAVLCLPWVWAMRNRWLPWLRLGAAVSGVGMVLYLVAVELVVVRAICLWCTAVHLVAFALFVAVLAAFLQPTGVGEKASLGQR